MPGREATARIRNGSGAHTALEKVFEDQQQADPDTFRELTAGRGLPLVVVLSNRGNGNGGSSLWIEEVTAIGWGPR
jgi:hypothetical protein